MNKLGLFMASPVRELTKESIAHTNAYHNGQNAVLIWFQVKPAKPLHRWLYQEARSLFPWDYLKEFRTSFFEGAQAEIGDLVS